MPIIVAFSRKQSEKDYKFLDRSDVLLSVLTVLIVRSSLMRGNHTQITHIAGDLSMNTSSWNKDRLIGQKSHFRYLISGGSESDLNWKVKRAIWLCSIWPWTVSYEAVIW